jgi:hypothetical protein
MLLKHGRKTLGHTAMILSVVVASPSMSKDFGILTRMLYAAFLRTRCGHLRRHRPGFCKRNERADGRYAYLCAAHQSGGHSWPERN